MQRRSFIKAYQYNVENQENELLMNEKVEYNVYEDAFYQNSPLSRNQINEYNNNLKSINIDFENFYNDIVKNNFVVINLIIKVVKCRKCHKDFNFNNVLHRHFRFDQHFNEVSLEIKSFTIITSTFSISIFVFIVKLITFEHVIFFIFTNSLIQDYAFRGFYYVIIII